MTRFIIFVFALLLSSAARGESVCIDGIWYDYFDDDAKTVTVSKSYESSYDGCYSGDVVIPNSINYNGINYSVTSIGNSAFAKCKYLNSVNIPSSVTTIEGAAFYGSPSMTSVNIPNSVTSIGGHAFYTCQSITSITIPNSVKFIGESAFEFCI